MKTKKLQLKQKVKQYWNRFMESSKVDNISAGAVAFEKTVTHATKDNWRHKETKKKPRHS